MEKGLGSGGADADVPLAGNNQSGSGGSGYGSEDIVFDCGTGGMGGSSCSEDSSGGSSESGGSGGGISDGFRTN